LGARGSEVVEGRAHKRAHAVSSRRRCCKPLDAPTSDTKCSADQFAKEDVPFLSASVPELGLEIDPKLTCAPSLVPSLPVRHLALSATIEYSGIVASGALLRPRRLFAAHTSRHEYLVRFIRIV
jgi:hypothetical protein